MSNTLMKQPDNMQDTAAINQRLTDLEIKASYAEDLIEQLDKVVVRQQQQIDLLIREVTELRHPTTDGGTGSMRSLRDDLPPHF